MASQDEILLAAIIKQIPVTGIDYRTLADDIGVENAGTAAKRWSRYKLKLKASTGISGGSEKGSPSKPVGVQKNGKGNGVKGKKGGSTLR